MKTIGVKDNAAYRDEKSFGSAFPCKHFFRIREVLAADGTLVDDGVTDSTVTAVFIQASGGNLLALSATSILNSQYVPADTDDIVMIDGGDMLGSQPTFTLGSGSNTHINIGDPSNGNFKVLDKELATTGLFSADLTNLRFITLKRSTGVANIYLTSAASDLVEDNLIGTLTGISGSFASAGATNAGKKEGNAWAIIAFANGSMPDDTQLMADFNQINQTWRTPNRLLPAGWNDKYTF